MRPEQENARAAYILDEIEELARSYWELEGRPEGRHLEHWLRAEKEVLTREGAGTTAAG